ncbi:MAG: FadR family transcriptional regulator [Clostridium sp.]|uniref:FadR/GntR family transcriptional regulator n=1 Tax=Clostridium sp. TaxID=1506 RepID=UPI0025BB585F|nr:FadR/GntR family transcriptional regulator [Clostridium sp.]MCE5222205.1 FadR family transcriptional regulator [Clostridium sp.]
MLNTIKNTRVYEQVIERIKDLIGKGQLRCGDKLPSERNLCGQLNVSRTSVREALRVLEVLGIIQCRIGEGNFIKDNFQDSLLEPLSMTFMLNGSKTDEIIDLRKFIEPGTAALAAKNINDEQLQEIKELVNLLNSTENQEKCAEIDKKIHYRIVQSSRNYLVSNIMLSVSTLVETYIEDVVMNMFQNEENKNIVRNQHEDIVQALENHDPVGASIAMLKHLEYTNSYISKKTKINE